MAQGWYPLGGRGHTGELLCGCGTSPSGNIPVAGLGKQQSEENTETTLSSETEDSENMNSNSTAKSLVVYFFD